MTTPGPQEPLDPMLPPALDSEFERECEALGVDPADRPALRALLARWRRPAASERERRAELLRDYAHWRLYERSRSGDAAAARAFERAWRRYVGAFLRGRYPVHEVEELTAQFFARVYRLVVRRHRWETGPFIPYLRTLLVNLCRDEGERRAERGRRELAGAEIPEDGLRSPAPSPEELLLAGERRRRLEEALARLEPSDLFLLTQVALEERPGPEVARELGIRLPALWKRVERAKKRLRELISAGETGQARAARRSRGLTTSGRGAPGAASGRRV